MYSTGGCSMGVASVSDAAPSLSDARVLHAEVTDLLQALHQRDERLCGLVDKLLSEKVLLPELRVQLRDMGIDLEVLRGCVEAYCRELRRDDNPARR